MAGARVLAGSGAPARRGGLSQRRAKFHEVVRGAVLRRGVAIMGVCNVTPDSFSDGGDYFDPKAAFARVDQLLEEGADILDIGGESTRPRSQPVPPKVQLERVLEVVRYAAARASAGPTGHGFCVSIDTTSPEVAAACLDAGAHAVNDVSLLADEDLARVTAGSGAALVLSHARAPQADMNGFGGWPLSAYDDVVRDVLADWERAAARAGELGVPRDALVMDPGLGFSKASRHSLELLRRTHELAAKVDVPVLIGASRKSFLTLVDPSTKATPKDRLGASIAAAVFAAHAGARIVRVHDVRDTRQALDLDVILGVPVGHADRGLTVLGEPRGGKKA
ncbi:MAG: dihydropteroate synthase [Deltaproteobacteria bacterium]|nr:dihydropteroate synthase [Deltaproteobacteria bacterium]